MWNEAARETFQNNLSSSYYREKFKALLSNVSLSPVELAKSIKLLLLENTKTSCLREKKTINDDNRNSQPWFDSECNMKKNEINKLGKAVRKCPLDSSARSDLNNAKKSFKRTILAKKRHYRQKMLSLLESKRNDGTQKEFWDLFRKISPKNKKEAVFPSLKKFFDHFQNLSNSSRSQNIPGTSGVQGPLDYEISLEELET